jgi:hypothetical protein
VPADLIKDPVIVLAAPRSGSSLLLAALSAHPDLWSLYKESNPILEGAFHPSGRGWESNALVAEDVDGQRAALHRAFFDAAGNLERLPFARIVPLRGRGRGRYTDVISILTRSMKRPPIRLVEKSPKNTLRVPFLRALFPDARFIHLTRDPAKNIESLYGGWQDPDRHNSYLLPEGFRIRGYRGKHWCFVLQPGWRSLDGADLLDVCADQWRACNEHCLRDLAAVPDPRALRVKFEDIIARPYESLARIAEWADLDPRPFARFAKGLPVIQPSTPAQRAARREVSDRVGSVLPLVASVRADLGYE